MMSDIFTPENLFLGLLIVILMVIIGLVVYMGINHPKNTIDVILAILSSVVFIHILAAIGAFANWVFRKTKGEA